MNQLLLLFMGIPLLTFLAVQLFKNPQEKSITAITQGTALVYLASAVGYMAWWLFSGFAPVDYKLATLYNAHGFVFALQFYYDMYTAVFSLVGAAVFFIVLRFSRYYMHRDEGFKRYFSTLLFFMLGYNLIIFSGNFETLFLGWEIIGLSSFLLIAYYRQRYLPVKNAFKTLSIYRLSDIALMLAMWLLHHAWHQNVSFIQLGDTAMVAQHVSTHSGITLLTALLFVLAAAAKSAQLPFTTWLPRAMEGPTSSSAVFYGSLSVHIGAFILLRTSPLWQHNIIVQITIIVIGAATAIAGSLIARVQPTVKTQIAYASAAQIGIIFIEIALGWHILALVHFAGNAFLRTYQLLVSPSVLNYLIHKQYFHYQPQQAVNPAAQKWTNTLYLMGIKEWGIDGLLYKYLWMPFKWIGRWMQVLNGSNGLVLGGLLIGITALGFYLLPAGQLHTAHTILPIVLLAAALLLILGAFSTRSGADKAWHNLTAAHLMIAMGIGANNWYTETIPIVLYLSGVLLAALIGYTCLQKIKSIDNDIQLNRFHGYVYKQKGTAFLFLLSAIGMLGFPITAAFIGIDILFTQVHEYQWLLITLTGLCFLFMELAVIRMYCRIFLGPDKKLTHPVAYRSS